MRTNVHLFRCGEMDISPDFGLKRVDFGENMGNGGFAETLRIDILRRSLRKRYEETDDKYFCPEEDRRLCIMTWRYEKIVFLGSAERPRNSRLFGLPKHGFGRVKIRFGSGFGKEGF